VCVCLFVTCDLASSDKLLSDVELCLDGVSDKHLGAPRGKSREGSEHADGTSPDDARNVARLDLCLGACGRMVFVVVVVVVVVVVAAVFVCSEHMAQQIDE
jgi:hypothetical protein